MDGSTGATAAPEEVVTKRAHYANFDWLRLAFAVQVVAIHAGVAPHILIQPVAAFLAVSGFVVLGSIERLKPRSFFINRALRVLPLLSATFIFIFFRYGSHEVLATITFWLWPFNGSPPINDVVWTLMYEEFFYAVLVVLFAVGFYRYLVFPIVVFLVLAGWLMTGAFFGIPSPFFLLGASFFLGNAAYLLRDWIARINQWVAVALLVAASLVMWRLPYTVVVSPPDTVQTFASIGAMLIFGIAGPRLPRLSFDFSYSLYLIHTLVRQELFGIVPFGLYMFGAVLLVTLPFCVLSWFLIERPAARFRRRGVERVEEPRLFLPFGPDGHARGNRRGAMDGLVFRLVLGAIFGAILGTTVGYFAYSTSSGSGGAGDLPYYLESIWSARDGLLWTGLGAALGLIWTLLRAQRARSQL